MENKEIGKLYDFEKQSSHNVKIGTNILVL